MLTQQCNQTEFKKCARYLSNDLIKENSKSAQNAKGARYQRNNLIKKYSKGAQDTNGTIQSNRILKVLEILTQQSNQREF